MTKYEQAEARISELFPHDDEAMGISLYDWKEGEEHLDWLINAPKEEIAQWIDSMREAK